MIELDCFFSNTLTSNQKDSNLMVSLHDRFCCALKKGNSRHSSQLVENSNQVNAKSIRAKNLSKEETIIQLHFDDKSLERYLVFFQKCFKYNSRKELPVFPRFIPNFFKF